MSGRSGRRKAPRDAANMREALLTPDALFDDPEAEPESEPAVDWKDELPRVIETEADVVAAAQRLMTGVLNNELSTEKAQAATPLLNIISKVVSGKAERRHKVQMLKRAEAAPQVPQLPPSPFALTSRTVTGIQVQENYGPTPDLRIPDPPSKPIFPPPRTLFGKPEE